MTGQPRTDQARCRSLIACIRSKTQHFGWDETAWYIAKQFRVVAPDPHLAEPGAPTAVAATVAAADLEAKAPESAQPHPEPEPEPESEPRQPKPRSEAVPQPEIRPVLEAEPHAGQLAPESGARTELEPEAKAAEPDPFSEPNKWLQHRVQILMSADSGLSEPRAKTIAETEQNQLNAARNCGTRKRRRPDTFGFVSNY